MAVNTGEIENNIRKQIDNEIALQRQSINQGLSTKKSEFDNTINRNNQYLDEQIKGLNTSRIVNDDKITALQNRRGGYYSGGLDYQLAENLRNTTGAQDNIRRDVNNKNQEVLGEYNILAKQAADQISVLERQAPDRIRELVNAEIDRQRAIQLEQEKWAFEQEQARLQQEQIKRQEAFQQQQFAWQQQMEQQQLALSRQKAATSAKTASTKAAKVQPKTKGQSYADGLAFWNSQIDNVKKQGAVRLEKALRSDPAQIQQLESQGYNIESVVDALYSAASGGRFENQTSYKKYMDTLTKNAY